MGILNVDLYKISLDYTNYNEDAPETITQSDFWLRILNLKNFKHLKKSKLRISACSLAS